MLRMNGIIYYYNEEMDYCKEGGGVGIRMIKSEKQQKFEKNEENNSRIFFRYNFRFLY